MLDPACGTGGFLACTIDHKRTHYVKSAQDEETLIGSIHGVEIADAPNKHDALSFLDFALFTRAIKYYSKLLNEACA